MDLAIPIKAASTLVVPVSLTIQVVAGTTAAILVVTALKTSAIALPLLILAGVAAFIGGWMTAVFVPGIPLLLAGITVAVACYALWSRFSGLTTKETA